jgi:signal transduction histidine kinase
MINGKYQFSSLIVLAISTCVTFITATTIWSINKWAEKAYRGENLLLKAGSELNKVSSFEWQSIAKHEIDNELMEKITESRTLTKLYISQLNNNEQDKKVLEEFNRLEQQYNKALDKEFELILLKQIQQAIKIDEEEVDPIFEKLSNQMNILSNIYYHQKQRANQISNLGITLSLLLAAGTLTAVSWRYNAFLLTKTQQLNQALNEIQETQSQLIQTEKMSSLGQMVAGIAHEINNPVSFIHGNIQYLKNYVQDLVKLVLLYQQEYPNSTVEIQNFIKKIELEFLLEDLDKIVLSMTNGTERITNIVSSLRNFARLDESDMKMVDLHEGIESTLIILNSKFINEIEIIKQYSDLPKVTCFPGILNQVFMNIINNAADALLSQKSLVGKQIVIQTEKLTENQISIKIRDNGPGIPLEIQGQIFDPFFTTKPVGKGTGLGLSISYQIIQKHHGKILLNSQVDKGTEFTIVLPIISDSLD